MKNLNKYIAECIGTYALVFCGTGAMVIDSVTGGSVSHVGVATTFGLIVMAMIYTFGGTSGAHINPAVTIAFWASGRFSLSKVPPYIVAQLIGAFLASLTLSFLFPTDEYLGATLPSDSAMQSFVLEIILTFFLMLVIIHVSTGSKEIGVLAGIAIGAVVGLEAMFAGPITGASMNPARSIAPAIVSSHTEHLWVYISAPIIGALLAIPAWKITRPK